MLKLQINKIHPLAIEVCQSLQTDGFQAFIVGGCVRDMLMENVPKDWDIATNAIPEQVMSLFPKTIPTGLQHGTVTVVLGEGVENHFEVTTFRTEGTYTDGRHPEEVSFVNSIELDLSRRDFTINAMAFDPISEQLVDSFNGINDLNSRIIKAVGNPVERFTEDGLRIMRAARFAARFNFQIEKETAQAMNQCLYTLGKVSKERIKDELCKTLMTQYPTIGFNYLLECGALSIACPQITKHPYFSESIKMLSSYKGDLETMVALLYCMHGIVPDVKSELVNLKFSNHEINKICFLLDLQLRFMQLLRKWSKVGFREFIAHIKNHNGDEWEHTIKEFIKLVDHVSFLHKDELINYNSETVLSKKEMKINGDHLISFGIKPGPQIKVILDLCYGEILHKPDNNTKEYLLNFANHFINDQIDPIC